MRSYRAGFQLMQCAIQPGYTLDLAVWYPTEKVESTYHYSSYIKGHVAQNAMMTPIKTSLVMISSGFAGTLYDQSYLAEALARRGYMVGSASHGYFDRTRHMGIERAWYRSVEIKCAINHVLNSRYASFLFDSSVALIGFSAGGFSSLQLAGATPSFNKNQKIKEYVDSISPLNFKTLHDQRVKALCLLAPALGNFYTKKELAIVHQPTLLMLAENDEVLLDSTLAYQNGLPNLKGNTIIQNAGHFVFNAEVSQLMRKLSPSNCLDRGVSRQCVHPAIIKEVSRFLDRYFKQNECEAVQYEYCFR